MSDDNSSDQFNESSQSAPQAQVPVAPAAEPMVATQQGSDDVSEHKLYAILGYILPFLFFLPLVQDSSKKNTFARFHANQQLILLVICIGLYLLSNIFYIILMSGAYVIMPLLNLAILVLVIMGIINAAQGQMKELPVVGKFKLIDKMFK